MTTTTPLKALSDSQIHQKVIEELKWDTRVKETSVGVEVDNGVVTLTGTVTSYGEKLAALEAAHRVAGVLDVANDVHVLPPGSLIRTDTEIAQAVRRTLEWDTMVPHEYIQTTVSNGWVTLEGTVPLWSQRQDAERAVRHLAGVRGVSNKIAVFPAETHPRGVRAAIEEALARQAEREAHDIQVEVKDGTICLTGRVRSWHEKRAILGAAGHAPGVRNVEDHLRVEP